MADQRLSLTTPPTSPRLTLLKPISPSSPRPFPLAPPAQVGTHPHIPRIRSTFLSNSRFPLQPLILHSHKARQRLSRCYLSWKMEAVSLGSHLEPPSPLVVNWSFRQV